MTSQPLPPQLFFHHNEEEIMDTSFDLSSFNLSELSDLSSTETPPFSPLSLLSPFNEEAFPCAVSTPTPDIPSAISTPLLAESPLPMDTSTARDLPLPAKDAPTPCLQWHGFKIVGDNIDKNLRPRHQTIDKQTQSLHYFNCYASLDRVDLSSFSSDPPHVDLTSLSIESVLPSGEDNEQILFNFAVIAGRVLAKYIQEFAKHPGLTIDHIEHSHSKEMSTRSKVVCDDNKIE